MKHLSTPLIVIVLVGLMVFILSLARSGFQHQMTENEKVIETMKSLVAGEQVPLRNVEGFLQPENRVRLGDFLRAAGYKPGTEEYDAVFHELATLDNYYVQKVPTPSDPTLAPTPTSE